MYFCLTVANTLKDEWQNELAHTFFLDLWSHDTRYVNKQISTMYNVHTLQISTDLPYFPDCGSPYHKRVSFDHTSGDPVALEIVS